MAKFKPGSDPRGGHVRLYWDMLDGNAWRCLSAADQRVYIALRRQLLNYNNGDLSLPFSFAKNHGIKSKTTLAKSLRALMAVGLVAVTRTAGRTKEGHRLPTLYRVTDEPVYEMKTKLIDARPPSNEWRDVKTLAQGRHQIREVEAKAAEKAAAKKKNPGPENDPVGPKNEPLTPLTVSKNGPWPISQGQKMDHGNDAQNAIEANNDAGFDDSGEVADSETHGPDNGLLYITTRGMGDIEGVVDAAIGCKTTVGRAGKSGKPKTAHQNNMETTP